MNRAGPKFGFAPGVHNDRLPREDRACLKGLSPRDAMKRILYVEDDALISGLYSQKLVEAGFDVRVACDGLAAIRQLVEWKPDLVVLDLLMPKLTGADVLKFIREKPELENVRIVVFSNSFLSGLAEQVAAAKVDSALVKSAVTPVKLVNAVREVLATPPSAEFTHPVELAEPKAEASQETPPMETQAERPLEPVATEESEASFRTRVQKEFFEQKPAILKSLRDLCRDFLEAEDPAVEKRRLNDLTRKMGFVCQMNSLAGCQDLANLSGALEALLFELCDKPALINDSSRQTVVSAVALLADRLDKTEHPEERPSPPASILVVDDDAVSSRAVVLALNRAKLQATTHANPFDALKSLEQTAYDLVLLDINMPGMDGITLCEKMRALPLHKRTPVIYVTGQTDFKTRARSLLSGGNDLISKPILPTELSVKTIAHLVKNGAA